MKVLYALQCTGNGHIARAQELLPLFNKYAEVDLLVSGHQSQIVLPQEPKFQFKGISLLYDAKGGLSYTKTALKNNFFKAMKDIKSVPVKEYDLVLNDFEPISAWACKLSKYPNIVGVSHQASMLFDQTPKPKNKNLLGELVLKHYAPTQEHFGFHFENYHPKIFKPIIRSAIRNLNPQNKGYYMTYLPSFSDEFLIEKLNETHVDWRIFSKTATEIYVKGNVFVFPIDQTEYLRSFENCDGILCNAGFETPAEALFLKKKLFVIPIKNQYEQECNAVALEKLGVESNRAFDLRKIQEWIDAEQKIEVDYVDQSEKIVRQILAFSSSERFVRNETNLPDPVVI
ncbi:glycosyltransferase family protein [Moheibacter lacus]|uniref:Glycosyl transferase n=1 Tax=Moheibacter lacus TaxID=2745851 RepID=A0A838ZS11_9FLAO|nr:glycosyltransferase family protein [Moheibacter lacus]MBA5629553.1 glycosyl transferase [Moheibacter lacus]